ncbi:glycosyl hydrolase family 32 [Nocardia jiangxiensis]|uniref:glycosyl hydrolase family 32 n=1 Tax=Nocardia jiangxiensis TaxID=282685 RepID=UPI000310C86A|nr:glycosyl hydrolase family 32 [Nocardia jiangxiensis]
MQVTAGSFRRIYDPSDGETHPWYVNDHTVIRDGTGLWHLFGITHPEPADPWDETQFAHATAEHLLGPWTKQPPALNVDREYGETHLWAPYVVDGGAGYAMFYDGGGADRTGTAMNLATSTDLRQWTRHPQGPLFRDGYDARDPMVLRLDDRWVMYYCATSEPAGGNHVVAYRTSTDLVHWSDRAIAYTDPATGTGAGPTESPFVVRHNDFWYLFVGPRPDYIGTDVFLSSDPLHFRVQDRVGHIEAHAAEIVTDDGEWWITTAGWGQGGVHIAPLQFADPT